MGPAEPVVDALRAAIIAGDFAPGEQLRQATVAERFGVSRIPVREALRALAAEGLLCHAPNRGYFVKKLDVAEMEQLYWMRGLLEQRVLQTATRPCPRLLETLRHLHAEMLRAEDDSDTNVLVRLNREFHWAIFDSSPETFVCDRVRQLWNISEAYRATYIAVRSDRERMHEHHAEMIQAIEQHDGEWLTKIHDLHRSDSEVVVTRLLRPQAVRTA